MKSLRNFGFPQGYALLTSILAIWSIIENQLDLYQFIIGIKAVVNKEQYQYPITLWLVRVFLPLLLPCNLAVPPAKLAT